MDSLEADDRIRHRTVFRQQHHDRVHAQKNVDQYDLLEEVL